MTFSEFSGTAFIPTLARLVLAGVFITAGYHKVFKTVEYSAEDAAELNEMGFKLEPVGGSSAMLGGVSPIEIVPASFTLQDGGAGSDDDQDSGGDNQDTSGDDAVGDQDTSVDDVTGGDQDTGGEGADGGADQDEPEELVEPDDDAGSASITGPMQGKGAGQVILMVEKKGWPQPQLMGWVASFTELVGGVLLLVGLFSRLWGAGLAITMAVAFYFTSWPGLSDGGFKLFTIYGNDPMLFTGMFYQLALMILAMLVLFAGPGPLSIDRLLFGKAAPTAEEEF